MNGISFREWIEMPHKPARELSPAALADRREYMARKKAESRARKREEGFCIVCGTRRPPEGGVTCLACNIASADRKAIAKLRAERG